MSIFVQTRPRPINRSLTTARIEGKSNINDGTRTMDNLQERIRVRAYEIWTANGYGEGEADQHWLTAEREVLAELTAQSPALKAAAARKPRPRATPTAAKPRTRAAG